MKRYLTRSGRIILKLVSGMLLFVASYFFAAGICTCIPVNTGFHPPSDGVEIAVLSNGVHTDIVVPAKNKIFDWTKKFPVTDVRRPDSTMQLISFGWGDKGFFIGTPTWADLKTSTAFKAMFWLSTSAMHVSWKKNITPGIRCRKIRISREKYLALCNYIEQTFANGKNGLPVHINAPGYSDHDAFYEAKGTYNLFRTCNVWTGNGLKTAGIRVAVWTPFEKCVFHQLP